jgi:hypothetical protein
MLLTISLNEFLFSDNFWGVCRRVSKLGISVEYMK